MFILKPKFFSLRNFANFLILLSVGFAGFYLIILKGNFASSIVGSILCIVSIIAFVYFFGQEIIIKEGSIFFKKLIGKKEEVKLITFENIILVKKIDADSKEDVLIFKTTNQPKNQRVIYFGFKPFDYFDIIKLMSYITEKYQIKFSDETDNWRKRFYKYLD